MNPIKKLRLLLTPPCSKCKNCGTVIPGRIPTCCCEEYLDYTEKIISIRYLRSDCTNVRGTRLCRFEPKEE